MHPKDLLEANLDLIDKIIGFTSRRHGWSDIERDDFGSYVKLKLIDNDYGILRKFRGTAKLKTYLTVVIHRLLLDYQNHKWGKWRPSAKARNTGPVAVQLETLTTRDGYSLSEAIETLRTNHRVQISEERLREIASSFPRRGPRRFEGAELLTNVPTEDRAEDRILDNERSEKAKSIESALAEAFSDLAVEDRLILKMRFEDGFSIAQIASILRLDQRPLYKRMDKVLERMRKPLEDRGIEAGDISKLLEWKDFALGVHYGVDSGKTRS